MMTRSPFLLVPLLLALTACETPQQACISAVSRDQRTVEALIAQTQANIQRGYGLATAVRTVPDYVDCTPRPTEANPKPKRQMCLVETAQTFKQPVAIDLAAEQVKLKQLLAKRDQLAKTSAAAVAQCQARYPEN
jgi:hypothetical protein